VIAVWKRANLPTIESNSILKKLKQTAERYANARKSAAKLNLSVITGEWMEKLFNTSKSHC